MWFSKLKDFFFPCCKERRKLISLFFFLLVLKFMWFNLLWCMLSTFTPFSKVETYLDTLLVSLFLLLPLVCFRAVKVTLVIFVLMDCLFISNLMYFRTYFTAIPLDSYLLAANLTDFSSSVFDSLRIADVFFPLSTLTAGILWWRNYWKKEEILPVNEGKVSFAFVRYVCLILLVALFPAIKLWSQNGFKAAYERLQDAYLHTCNIPMYTIFGSLYYLSLIHI